MILLWIFDESRQFGYQDLFTKVQCFCKKKTKKSLTENQ